uniref:Cytochrome P450-11 n=1 Tax=Cephus cinctus TaxID=211228 RepID=A0A1W6L1I8_CEPCN|nr:cytochrome P450-11 [Cephus cinctus]
MKDNLSNKILSMLYAGKKWYTRRKLITPSFHSGLLEQYLKNSIREADILVTKLRAEVNKNGFNIVPYAKLAALDVICVSAMGYHINAQSNCTNEYVLAVDKAARITQERFVNIWISLDVIFKRTTAGKEFKKALEIMDRFTEKVITGRKAEWRSKRDGNFNEFPKKRKALLDMLLEMSDDGKILSDEDIREEVNTFMFAGHDTVATSVSWILYALGRFPKYQNLILEEYDRIIGSNDITLEDLNKLDWLEACIKESWRLYPVTPLIARQISDPLRLRDTDIPSGSTILINSYILNRDPRHYAQPEMYYPERFLPDKPKPPPFAFIPFSAGSRNCIGAKFALIEVKVMILRILNAYNIHSLDSEDKLRLTAELVLANTGGLRLAITPRHSPA